MDVYSSDINGLDNLIQKDKEERGHGYSPKTVKQKQKLHTLSKKEIVQELKKFKLCTSGRVKVLHKRLDMYYNKRIHCASGDDQRKIMFDYCVVIDFEATCDSQQKFKLDQQEIIEFPAILLNCKNGKLEDEFQSYCCPIFNPRLTDYCSKLTGITQDIVDKAPSFHQVFAAFNDWMKKKKLGSEFSFAIVTDGSKDMGHFLRTQCALSNIFFPEYGKYWINIRETFGNFYGMDVQHRARMTNDTVLNAMICEIGSKFKGRAHSGLDDARNIAYIVQRLLEDGASLIFNEKLPEESIANNGKRLFALPALRAEVKSIKGMLKSNFPLEHSIKHALDNTLMNEATSKSGGIRPFTLHDNILEEKTSDAAIKEIPATSSGKQGSKLAQTVHFTKDNVRKNQIDGAVSKDTSKNDSSVYTSTKALIKVVPSKSNRKTPTGERKPEVRKGETQAIMAKEVPVKKTSVKTPTKGTTAKIQVKENPIMIGPTEIWPEEKPVKTQVDAGKIKVFTEENPVKTNPKKTPVRAASEETAARFHGKKTPVTPTIKNNSANLSIQSTAKKSEAIGLLPITASENPGGKTNKKRHVEVAVKGNNGDISAKICEKSNQEKTAEGLAKELKFAKQEFYRKIQYSGFLTEELKVAKKNMKVLKKCLNHARSKEAVCVSVKPLIEDDATRGRTSNVAKEPGPTKARKKKVCNSQTRAKNEVSSGKMGTRSESEGSLGTVLRDMKTSPHVGTAASFSAQDVKQSAMEESTFDEPEEELFLRQFEEILISKLSVRDK